MTTTAPTADQVVLSAYGKTLWDADGLTEYGTEVFTEGDCWALAWHVALMTGGALHAVTTRWPGWEHVVVKVGPDAYLDALGVHTAQQVRDYWNLPSRGLVPLDSDETSSLEAYTDTLEADFVFLITHDDAAAVARRVIETHLTGAH